MNVEVTTFRVWFDGFVHIFDGYIGQPPLIGSIISLKEYDYRVRSLVYDLDTIKNGDVDRYISVKVDVEQI
jgi:hypothetical protein